MLGAGFNPVQVNIGPPLPVYNAGRSNACRVEQWDHHPEQQTKCDELNPSSGHSEGREAEHDSRQDVKEQIHTPICTRFHALYPCQDSNLDLGLRKAPLCPLSYRGRSALLPPGCGLSHRSGLSEGVDMGKHDLSVRSGT